MVNSSVLVAAPIRGPEFAKAFWASTPSNIQSFCMAPAPFIE